MEIITPIIGIILIFSLMFVIYPWSMNKMYEEELAEHNFLITIKYFTRNELHFTNSYEQNGNCFKLEEGDVFCGDNITVQKLY